MSAIDLEVALPLIAWLREQTDLLAGAVAVGDGVMAADLVAILGAGFGDRLGPLWTGAMLGYADVPVTDETAVTLLGALIPLAPLVGRAQLLATTGAN